MRINTSFFARQIQKRFFLKPGDKILDYGCGPGLLADYFDPKGIKMTGADINKYYLEQCRKNHPESVFIEITTDKAFNRKAFDDKLKGTRFNYVTLLSITQYFENEAEVERVIHFLMPYIQPNGKIIIADVIDENTSSVRDALSLLYHCLRRGMLIAFAKFILYLLSSDYRMISKNAKLLKLSEQTMNQVATRNTLLFEKVGGLTIHSTRTNYIFTKV